MLSLPLYALLYANANYLQLKEHLDTTQLKQSPVLLNKGFFMQTLEVYMMPLVTSALFLLTFCYFVFLNVYFIRILVRYDLSEKKDYTKEQLDRLLGRRIALLLLNQIVMFLVCSYFEYRMRYLVYITKIQGLIVFGIIAFLMAFFFIGWYFFIGPSIEQSIKRRFGFDIAGSVLYFNPLFIIILFSICMGFLMSVLFSLINYFR